MSTKFKLFVSIRNNDWRRIYPDTMWLDENEYIFNFLLKRAGSSWKPKDVKTK